MSARRLSGQDGEVHWVGGREHWARLRPALSFQSQETREILHFHYTTWPDFGVPESPASFLNFLFKVRESGSLSLEYGPIVVHCSAGIGRSGTFCLADTCLLLVRAWGHFRRCFSPRQHALPLAAVQERSLHRG